MKPRLPMAVRTSDATVLLIASMAMEAGGAKKSPSARAAVGAALWHFIPMALSNAEGLISHWIVNSHFDWNPLYDRAFSRCAAFEG
jgi:hypothetical protein